MRIRDLLIALFTLSQFVSVSSAQPTGSSKVLSIQDSSRQKTHDIIDPNSISKIPLLGSSNREIAPRKEVEPPWPVNNSRLTFEEPEFDFGHIPQAARVIHNFKVFNTGTDTLVILAIIHT